MYLVAVLSLVAHAASGAPVASTQYGAVVGVAENGLAVWRGVPYAAPPVGKLRWRAPEPHASWPSDPARQTTASLLCPQANLIDPTTTIGDEDCLGLDVYAPPEYATSSLPVLVWIHGGGFTTELPTDQGTNASRLVRKSMAMEDSAIVMVSIKYRLGGLGFMASAALANESTRGTSGNYGTLDQIFALEW
jgi:para-nitrobenzyl esterase